MYPIGIPALFAYKLWKRRANLDNDVVMARYGFLYLPYRSKAFLWDIWEMLRKLFLTGVIVLIFPGKTFQVIVAAMSNICFLTILAIEKPHLPGPGRTLANMSNFAITFTMMLGLILKSVDDVKEYNGLIAFLLISTNGSVCLFVLYLIVVGTCGSVLEGCKKSKPGEGKKKISIEARLNNFFTATNIELGKDVCMYLKMSKEQQEEFKAKGELEEKAAAHYDQIEIAMLQFDKEVNKSREEARMIRILMGKKNEKSNDKSSAEKKMDHHVEKKKKKKKKQQLTKVTPSSNYSNIPLVSLEREDNVPEKAKNFWNEN